MRKIIASLDIGTNTIKLIVGEMIKEKLNVLTLAESPSKGVVNGKIINLDLLVPIIKNTLKKAEDILDLKVHKLIITVPSSEAQFLMSDGYTTITNEEKMVKGVDIIRAMQASVYNKIPRDLEVVNIVPASFKLDEEIIKNPLNQTGEKLSVKTVMTLIPKKNIYPLVQSLEKLGIEVIDVSLTSIGDYHNLKNDKLNTKIGAIINIGAGTTTISIFNKGVLTNTKVLALGGINIDNDLAYIYNLDRQEAKNLKETFCLANVRMAQASIKETILNKNNEKIEINQYEASEIVSSRIEEILNLAKKEINHLTKKEIHYIIVTGGISEMPDFELSLENVFGKNGRLAKTYEIGARNNKYSSGLGLIKYYNEKAKLKGKEFSIFSLEEQDDLSNKHKKVNVSDNSILGKLFGYFFDN